MDQGKAGPVALGSQPLARLISSINLSLLGGHQKRGIEIDTIPAHPPMEMRSRGTTGVADFSN